jgi:hypothetical protein
MSSPESLWIRVRKDIAARVSEVIDRRTVTGVEAGGKVRVISADPDEPDERPMSRVRGLALGIGDEVVTVRMPGGHDVVVAAMARAGDTFEEYALADHQHNAANGNYDSTVIGRASTGTDRATVYGVGAVSGDAGTAIGNYTNATGYIGTVLGWGARALAQGAITIGYTGLADKLNSVALDWQARAQGVSSIAIGDNAWANADRSAAIGINAFESVADKMQLKFNEVIVVRSNGAGSTKFTLLSPDGGQRTIEIANTNRLFINGRAHATIGENPGGMWPNNKSIASGGPFNFRAAPVVDPANLIGAPAAGSGVYDTGWRYGANSFTWAYILIHGWGWGYIVQEGLV